MLPGAAPQLASLRGTTRGPSCKKLVQRTQACSYYHLSPCNEHVASGPDPGLFLSLPVVDSFCSDHECTEGRANFSHSCVSHAFFDLTSVVVCVCSLIRWCGCHRIHLQPLVFFLVEAELHSRPGACPGFHRDFRTEPGIGTLSSTYTQCFAPC